MDRVQLALAGLVAATICFARRRDARVFYSGRCFTRNSLAGHALALCLLFCRVVSAFAYLLGLLELLSRKFLGLFFDLITDVAHELILGPGSRQQSADRGAHSKTHSSQHQRLVAAKVHKISSARRRALSKLRSGTRHGGRRAARAGSCAVIIGGYCISECGACVARCIL